MAYSRKPKYTEKEPPKGRSLVYYLGAHPWHSRGLPGVRDEGEFVSGGSTGYHFDLVDPKDRRRYSVCDLPQHLLVFTTLKGSEGEQLYEVRPTAKDRKMMEVLQRSYTVTSTGELKARAEAAQMEADLSRLLGVD